MQCYTSVRTAGHFARYTPDSDFFLHTFCTVHTVHTVCSPSTLVVNPLLTTIAHHIFSCWATIYISSLPRAVTSTSYHHLCWIPSREPMESGRFTAHHFRSIRPESAIRFLPKHFRCNFNTCKRVRSNYTEGVFMSSGKFTVRFLMRT
jgi:hypothetical protein